VGGADCWTYAESRLLTGKQISYVFGVTALGAIISPLIAGWIADRLMSAQLFTALSHFVGAVFLIIAWRQTTFRAMWTAICLYAILYMPTIALTNAISFHHMRDSKRFGNIRVWGRLAGLQLTG
jgi:MFS family permease